VILNLLERIEILKDEIEREVKKEVNPG